MTERLDACVARKRGEKTYWTKIGVAWPQKSGGWRVVLDALPLADEKGEVVINLFEPKSRDGGRQTASKGHDAPLDDEVPF